MHIYGLLGKKHTGKDTLADYIVEKYGYEKLAFAGTLKNVCKEIFDFSDQQLYGDQKEQIDPFWKVTPREIFQYVGTDLFRNQIGSIIPGLCDNIWIKVLEKKVERLRRENKGIVISDVRFQNELDAILEWGGKVFKIERETDQNSFSDHSSEQIDQIKNYSAVLHNTSSKHQLFEQFEKVRLF